MFRLIRVRSATESEDYGLWATLKDAVFAAHYRLYEKKEAPPEVGWVVQEQGKDPRTYFFNPPVTDPIDIFDFTVP